MNKPQFPAGNGHYHIGLILSQSGITDAQMAEIKFRIKELAKVMTDNWEILFWVPGFANMLPSALWPQTMKAISELPKSHVEFFPGAEPSVAQLFHEMREYDEVWCLPAKGQARLTKCRVSQLYNLSQESEYWTTSRAFKWIPYWMGADKLPKGKKK